MTLENLTSSQLRQIISIKERIESLQAEMAAIVGDRAEAAPSVSGKRTMSAAGRERIAAAQRARWAKARGQSDGAPSATPKTRRKMSAAGRARIAAAARARWAKAKAEGRTSL